VSIRIGFTGDFCPCGRMEQSFRAGQDTMLGIKPFFAENDFNILDLECPLTTGRECIAKTGPHLKAHPDTAALLTDLHCTQVLTANNHFKDYGWAGMQDTYRALEKENIQWLGSGKDLREASQPLLLEKAGMTIALLNMTEHEWSIAGPDEPGCNPIDLPRSLQLIRQVREAGSDFVVVVLHGGHEHYPLPSPRMKAQFRFMIDAGADAVLGHHTHIISGYEVYRGKPIFYSLGNFCFDWPGMRGAAWNKGLLVRLLLEKGRSPRFEYSFVHQNDAFVGVRPVDENTRQELESELTRLNLLIADDEALSRSFDEYANRLRGVMLSRIQPYRSRMLVALHKRGLLPDIMGRSKQRMLQILAQCESHREVLLWALNKGNA
jgi:poly-gamma-glutamate capsule biosynthesis protein CapA/YwtB (metallophosphatase superfamily)